MAGSLEGPVSRYLNRRVSVPAARILAHTPVTPNQVSVSALAVAGGAFALLWAGRNVEAGVLIQASSVIDGIDGDLARAKQMASRFGGVFDAVLDRYADALIAGGMGWYAYRHEDWPQPLLLAFAAAVGFLLVSYSRARLETEVGVDAVAASPPPASRDVRLLVLAVGVVVGQCWLALALVATLSYLSVALRLARIRSRPG